MATLNANAIQYNGANQAGGYTLKPDAYYDKLLLKMLRQMEFHYAKYAVEKSLPKNYGDTINWRRFNKLAVTKIALTEGETPAGQTISGSEVTAVIAQYGNVMYFTDVIDLQQLDKVRQEYTVELGFQAKETLDEIVRDVLVAEGSAYFAGGVTEIPEVVGAVKIDDFRKIMLAMKKGFIGGNRKAGGKYVALVAPEIMFALFDDRRVQDFMSFGQTNSMFGDGSIVEMFGMRFEEVLNAPVVDNTAGNPVFDSIIIGEEAYAITKLEGAGLRVITKGLGSAGVEDPLDQRQSIGWKITGFGAKVLNAEALVNYWSAALFDPDGQGADTIVNDTAPNYSTFNITFAPTTADGATLPNDKVIGVLSGQTLAQAVAGLDAAPTGGNGAISYYLAADQTSPVALTYVLTEADTIYVKAV